MPMPYARIAITLPKDVLSELDRRAKQLDQSRSRAIVAAIRAYLSAPSPAVAREAVPAYGTDAFGAARRAQLERDLARSPAERILKALATLGYGVARAWTATEILKRQITVVGDDPRVDIFTVAWSIKYAQAAPRSDTVAVAGVRIPLIGIDDLIETKRTGRLQDAADIEVLEEIRRRGS